MNLSPTDPVAVQEWMESLGFIRSDTPTPDGFYYTTHKELPFGTWILETTAQFFYNVVQQQMVGAQQNAVAWTVGVIDEIHMLNARTDSSGERDRLMKGIKNTIRDRYKAETGVDPAPHYPIKAALNQHNAPEGGDGA